MSAERVDAVVELLAQFDEGRAVFGAAQHGYECEAPMSEKALAAFEQRAKITLPDEYRAFLRDHWSSGAGPYYGLMPLPEPSDDLARAFDPALAPGAPLAGAIPLADQGCAMTSVLVVTGPHRGEVWFDRRDNGGPMSIESKSFDAWMHEWLDRALVEASQAIFPAHVSMPGWDPHPLLDAAAEAIERRAATSREPTPIDEQYPMDATSALAYLRIYQSRFDEALAVFERIHDMKEDDFEPAFRLACARVHRAKGEPEKWLEAARAGLEHEDAWFATRADLLREASEASFALERAGDAIGFCEELAKHTGEVQDHLMVAWHRVMTGDASRAASWILDMAKEGIGCDADASTADRVDELVHHGFLEALAGETAEGAKALEKELKKRVSS